MTANASVDSRLRGNERWRGASTRHAATAPNRSSFALSLADDHLENESGVFGGASDLDHVGTPFDTRPLSPIRQLLAPFSFTCMKFPLPRARPARLHHQIMMATAHASGATTKPR
jgi:hypothetical protein